MKRTLKSFLAIALAAAATTTAAHHSFAVWDMSQNIEFKGVVETVKFRNPHAALTLVETQADGTKRTINFTETAPANMLVRQGVTPEILAPGKAITAIGAPRRDNASEYFLKAIVTEDGQRFQIMPP